MVNEKVVVNQHIYQLSILPVEENNIFTLSELMKRIEIQY